MKISYDWLQSFFEHKLPPPKEVADALTMHSFEVEAVHETEKDTVFDIDVLPNRAHDCLAHYGVAREVSVVCALPMSRAPLTAALPDWQRSLRLFVNVEDFELCPRYSAVVIENVTVGPSPAWLTKRLHSIGERSVNNIVDAVNYVMFDIGQPLHAFDVDSLRVSGGAVAIGVRVSHEGEEVTTLDGVERKLPAGTLLITDATSNVPLGIAGIKGGSASGVCSETGRVIIEAANFNPVQIRKSSRALGLRTGASVRFEHALASEFTMHALREAAALITKIAGAEETRIEGFVDCLPGAEDARDGEVRHISVSVGDVGGILGSTFQEDDIAAAFKRLGFSFSTMAGSFTVTPPFERLDLTSTEDLTEEVGRIAGYEGITPRPPRPPEHAPSASKRFSYASMIRHALTKYGFSEVYTYVFRDTGEIELANPLAGDKRFLRASLVAGMGSALEQNLLNADPLGLERVRLFEIGTVFRSGGERLTCSLAVGDAKVRRGMSSPTEELDSMLAVLNDRCGGLFVKENVDTRESSAGRAIYEIGVEKINLAEAIESLMAPPREPWGEVSAERVCFRPISSYPFVVRDIAVWTPDTGSRTLVTGERAGELSEMIRGAAGELVVTVRLFDTFEKDDRTSYAFRLVFQSAERTLTDEEVNYHMWQITKALETRAGFEVR